VFHPNINDKASTAAQSAQAAAQLTAQSVGSAAQGMGKTVRQQVHTARGWAAPRLEDAADYCTATVAPRVSSAIRATAKQVRPEDTTPSKSRIRPSLSWPFLVIAALAAAGAAAAIAVARQRYKAAIDADTEPDTADLNQDTAAEEGARSPEASADPSMNGQVTSPGHA
jgi:hypothetical protein